MTHTHLDPLGFLGAGNGRYREAAAAASCCPADAPGVPVKRTVSATYFAGCQARETTIEDAGIRAGEIVGYRAWTFRRERLHSMFAPFEWEPGSVVDATGEMRLHGVHAFKTLREAIKQYGCYACEATVIFGTVDLWGEVIEHDKGYRAQFGAIRKLICSRDGIVSPFAAWRGWRSLRRARRTYCHAPAPQR